MFSFSDRSSKSHKDLFEAIYSKTFDDVFRYLLRRTDSQQDAEDLIAEVYTTAWKKLSSVPANGELPWLYTTAHNHLRNYWRKQSKKRDNEQFKELQPEDAVEQPTSESNSLAVCIKQLKEDDAEIIRLSCWEGLSPKELAEVYKCSTNAIYIKLHRAKERLQQKLAEQDPQLSEDLVKETAAVEHITAGDQAIRKEQAHE